MAQHFLLSATARTLSLKAIYRMGEEKSHEAFCKMRWPETNGAPICPCCGCAAAYNITTRRRFKCKACHNQYSVTSGTILASRKMSFTDLLAAICICVNAAKGLSMLQLSRDLNCQYKTVFVLVQKLREALASEVAGKRLSGDVEIDGAHFGGHIRPENLVENRKDRRLSKHKTGKSRVVVVMRERKGRTLPFVVRHEYDGAAIIPEIVSTGTRIYADEATHWDPLHGKFKTYRINHSEGYSIDGANTNQAESYFSRLRRMVSGQHHHVSSQYLHCYALEAAWKEDHRREDNATLAGRMLDLAMAHPVSRNWKGYWQRAICA